MSKDLKSLTFLGASVFPEISQIVRDINQKKMTYEMTGILDDNADLCGTKIEGVPVLGPLEMAKDMDSVQFVMGIGAYKSRLVRYEIIKRLGIPPERYATLIHPFAQIYDTATIGHGCIICAGVVVHNNCTVENFVKVLANSIVGANNTICEGVMITSLVSLTVDVVVGHYAHLGTMSAIGERVRIGPGAQVAMGSLVLKDVSPGAFVIGSPARAINKVEVPQELMDRWDALMGKDKAGVQN